MSQFHPFGQSRLAIVIKKKEIKNRQQEEDNKRSPDLQADFKSNQQTLASFAALTCGSNLQAGGEHKVNSLRALCIH